MPPPQLLRNFLSLEVAPPAIEDDDQAADQLPVVLLRRALATVSAERETVVMY